MNKPNKKKQIQKLHDELIFEVACLHCGKTNFNLPYILDSFSQVTCPECKQLTIAHVLNDGGIAIATQEERNKAYHAFSKKVDSLLRKTKNRILSHHSYRKYDGSFRNYPHLETRLISEDEIYGLQCDLVEKETLYYRKNKYDGGEGEYTRQSPQELKDSIYGWKKFDEYEYDHSKTYNKYFNYGFKLSFFFKYKGLFFYTKILDETYGNEVSTALKSEINHIKEFLNSYNNEFVLDIPNKLELQTNDEPEK